MRCSATCCGCSCSVAAGCVSVIVTSSLLSIFKCVRSRPRLSVAVIAQQRIQLARAIECVKIVAAADMALADPDLRHCIAATALLHFRAQFAIAVDGNVAISDTLAVEQSLGRYAIGTGAGGVQRHFHKLSP